MQPIYPGATTGVVTVDHIGVPFVDTETSGTPLVLLHGVGGGVDKDFFYLLPMPAARHRVIAIDFQQPADGSTVTMGRLCDQVLAVLDIRIGSMPVVMVGFSLGAAVAPTLAAESPDRISKLILLAVAGPR